MPIRPRLIPAAALLWAAASALPAHATSVAIAADDQWRSFTVSALDAQSLGVEWIDADDSLSPGFGSALDFTFTIAAGSQARLTVVDAGFAGDTYTVTNFGAAIGSTSAVPAGVFVDDLPSVGDFDLAFADPLFSRAVFTLGAGSYSISGLLGQSVTFLDGTPLEASFGGIRLTAIAAVPEPSQAAMLIAAAGLIGGVAARRRRGA